MRREDHVLECRERVSAGTGSCSKTSSPAPADRARRAGASTRAAWSTIGAAGDVDQERRSASSARAARWSIRWCVSGVSGEHDADEVGRARAARPARPARRRRWRPRSAGRGVEGDAAQAERSRAGRSRGRCCRSRRSRACGRSSPLAHVVGVLCPAPGAREPVLDHQLVAERQQQRRARGCHRPTHAVGRDRHEHAVLACRRRDRRCRSRRRSARPAEPLRPSASVARETRGAPTSSASRPRTSAPAISGVPAPGMRHSIPAASSARMPSAMRCDRTVGASRLTRDADLERHVGDRLGRADPTTTVAPDEQRRDRRRAARARRADRAGRGGPVWAPPPAAPSCTDGPAACTPAPRRPAPLSGHRRGRRRGGDRRRVTCQVAREEQHRDDGRPPRSLPPGRPLSGERRLSLRPWCHHHGHSGGPLRLWVTLQRSASARNMSPRHAIGRGRGRSFAVGFDRPATAEASGSARRLRSGSAPPRRRRASGALRARRTGLRPAPGSRSEPPS